MKIGIVSDIHIHAHPNRNPDHNEKYRLYQGSRVVSKNIIEVFKQHNCDAIIIAGDVVEKQIIRPYVQAEVKYFLDSIMSQFQGGWIIWGNHDLDCKLSDQSQSDSVLGVILPPNLIYAHQQIVNINGTTIAFSNWQPEFDLSWIQTPVDFLITHARINYQKGGGVIKSQELDESKFNLAICGDIHSPGAKGKYVSIGVPQMNKVSDSIDSTGIVLDTDTKQYKWVNLNPHDNLIKFVKTDQKDLEDKWDANTHTFYVYERPKIIDPTTGVSVSIPAWSEVQTLVDSAILANNLQDVHNEILKYVAGYNYQEVDFNFTMTKFSCKNWRSIDDCTMYFDEGDKILIQGANGSGKSSLLSAIKYAFVDVADTKGLSSLKPFIQFGSKDCWTEVEFKYQNNLYRIKRGTKDYGLWVNDERLKYSDKKSFEADVRSRFPFIKYMDIFFLDADHNQLIGGMSVEKKSTVISGVLKLSKIDMYNEIAINLQNDIKKNWNNIITQINELEKVNLFITEKINEIKLPTIPLNQLTSAKQEGELIENNYNNWLNYYNRVSPLSAQLNIIADEIKKLEKKKRSFRSDLEIDNKISEYQNQITEFQKKIFELSNLKTTIEFKEKELNDLKKEGNKAYLDAMNISVNSKCSVCGQPIATADSVIKHKEELLKKVDEIKSKVIPLTEEINNLKQTWGQSEAIYNDITSKINNLNNLISDLKSEKKDHENTEKDLNDKSKKYKEKQKEIQSIPVVNKVDLPTDFRKTMENINLGIQAWINYNNLVADRDKNVAETANLKQSIDKLTVISTELDRYIKLTGPAGDIYSVILNKLATEFSDGIVKYEVRKYTCRGEHLNLESMYNNNGNWIDYEACSSGQKTMLDIHFLQKIIPRMGVLIMDEFLKHLDPENHDLCIETIQNMNIGCTMISSHMESIAAFNNKSCRLSLNDSGLTQIDFK